MAAAAAVAVAVWRSTANAAAAAEQVHWAFEVNERHGRGSIRDPAQDFVTFGSAIAGRSC